MIQESFNNSTAVPAWMTQLKNLRVVWVFLTLASLIFILLPMVVVFPAPVATTPEEVESLKMSLYTMMGFACFIGVSSLFIWHFGFTDGRFKVMAKTATSEDDVKTKLARYCSMLLIVCWALNESVASFGLVVATLDGKAATMIPYGAAALLMNLYMFPRSESLIDRILKFRM